jgi:hypothetical protein
MFEQRPRHAEERKARAACSQAPIKEAVDQLHKDAAGQVLQIKPTGYASPAQPQPMRIRILHNPAAQDVS